MRTTSSIVSNDTGLQTNKVKRLHLPTAVLGISLVPSDHQRAMVACMDGVYDLNLESGESAHRYSHDSYVSGIEMSPQGQHVVTCGYDGKLVWFDTQQSKIVHSTKVMEHWCWDLAIGQTIAGPSAAKTSDENSSNKTLAAPGKKRTRVAVCGGRYLAGDYSYHPRPDSQPTVMVFDLDSHQQVAEFSFLPPVQCVAISRDGIHVAAANLMGDVAVWNIETKEQVATWNTPDFTAFGVIKSHCQIGGIYAMQFAENDDLLVCGMGPMHDPMAGNGKQRWQQFRWRDAAEVEKVRQSRDDQVGEGLMETLCFMPQGNRFVMGGRLRGGAWSTAFFDLESGDLVHSIKSDSRVTQAIFGSNGNRLYLAGAINQSADPNHKFGVVDVYDVTEQA